MRKLKKPLFICISTVLITVAAVILCISPILKYVIEKYDEKYTGRQITIDWVYVNPFTGYMHFNNFKIYELKSDSIFFSANGCSINIEMLKLFYKTYEISDFTLNHPWAIVIQNKKDFNFKDLLKKFSSDEPGDTIKAPVHFNILNVKIKEGEFHYREKVTPINYFIKKVNFESTGKRWDADTVAAKFSFQSGIRRGDAKGDFTINIKNMEYRLAIIVHKFDLNIIEQYLNDLTNYGSFSASLDADMKAKGNINDQEDITISGQLAINDFHFGKNPNEDYASFDKFAVGIKEVSPRNKIYFYDSVSLTRPYFKYERYDQLDNLQNMFGKNGSNISAAKADPERFNLVLEMADYIKELSKNFLRSPYRINRLAIYNADLKYNDYSLSEKFSMDLNPLSIRADSIDKSNKRVNIFLKSGIKPYGNVSATLSINPKDSTDFDMHYNLQKLPASLFNPYTISYTSFPLDRGTIEFYGAWKVRNGIIQSNNHLLVIDPRVARRQRNKDTKWIPTPLIMYFIRESGNVIDYEIPITGNLKNPKFRVRDVLFDLIENIFFKPPTTPYRMEVKTIETEIEKSLTLKWEMRQILLRSNQEKFIRKMADFLTKNPEAFIAVYPQQYATKEKEYILFFEAKKKYYMASNNKDAESLNEEEIQKINKMSIRDKKFMYYLNTQVKDTMLFTVQEKCAKLVGSAIVDSKLTKLNNEREAVFLAFFNEKGVDNRVKISPVKKIIPYNGFSFYRIEYNGKFPESLIDAFRKMNELDDDEPRKKFKKERKKSGRFLNEDVTQKKRNKE